MSINLNGTTGITTPAISTDEIGSGTTFSIKTNDLERIGVDASGRVTMPYQPIVHASQTDTTVFSPGATFNPSEVQVNIGNHYSSSTGLFTAPVAGVYQLAASFLVRPSGSSGTFLSVKTKINGTVAPEYGAIYGSNFTTEINCAGVFQVALAANDTIGLQIDSNGNVELYARESFMSVRLVG